MTTQQKTKGIVGAIEALEAGDFWQAVQAIDHAVEAMNEGNPHKRPMHGAMWAIRWIANVEGVQSLSALSKLLENHGFRD